jgi:TM2 domain-containing membrane protein YozV
MYTLKCLAGLIVWTSIIGIILLFSAVGFVFFYNAGIISDVSTVTGYMNIPTISGGSKT